MNQRLTALICITKIINYPSHSILFNTQQTRQTSIAPRSNPASSLSQIQQHSTSYPPRNSPSSPPGCQHPLPSAPKPPTRSCYRPGSPEYLVEQETRPGSRCADCTDHTGTHSRTAARGTPWAQPLASRARRRSRRPGRQEY